MKIGLCLGFKGGEGIRFCFWGGFGLGIFMVGWLFLVIVIFDDLVFVCGGVIGFIVVFLILILFLGFFLNIIEWGLGIGVGLERDEVFLISLFLLLVVVWCVFELGRIEFEFLFLLCDVCCVEGWLFLFFLFEKESFMYCIM